MNNNYVYLSHFLNKDTPTYGDRDKFTIKENSSISKGDTANSSSISFSTNHMGTHIDLPKHFIDNGKTLSDFEPGYWFYNNIALIDVDKDKGELIIPEDINDTNIDKNCELLLIRTGFEKFRNQKVYWEANPGVDPSVADYIRSNFPNIRTIGFDFISLTSFVHRPIGKIAHNTFLSEVDQSITIIEDMRLSQLNNSPLKTFVFPLLVSGIDSASVTVIAQLNF